MTKIILAADVGGTTCKLGILHLNLQLHKNGLFTLIHLIVQDIHF